MFNNSPLTKHISSHIGHKSLLTSSIAQFKQDVTLSLHKHSVERIFNMRNGRLLADCLPFVSQQTNKGWPTDNQQLFVGALPQNYQLFHQRNMIILKTKLHQGTIVTIFYSYFNILFQWDLQRNIFIHNQTHWKAHRCSLWEKHCSPVWYILTMDILWSENRSCWKFFLQEGWNNIKIATMV